MNMIESLLICFAVVLIVNTGGFVALGVMMMRQTQRNTEVLTRLLETLAAAAKAAVGKPAEAEKPEEDG